MTRLLSVLVLFTLPAVPAPVGATPEPASTATQLTALTGTPAGEALELRGAASFGGQGRVQVADDPANDANLTPEVGDREGIEPGVDLLAVYLAVPATPELVVQWQVANLPANGMLPEAVRYTFPFKVGSATYVAQAKFSNATDPDLAASAPGHAERAGAAFELRGNCTASFQGTPLAHCSHLAVLPGSVDVASSTISVRIPLGSSVAPELVPGAVVRRNDAAHPDLNDIIAGYQIASTSPATPADDRATFGPPGAPTYAFPIPERKVSLGVAPVGSDPRDVDYGHPASVAADGSFTGTVPASTVQPGVSDVFARACFGANCGYRSLAGASLALGDLVAALSVAKAGEPDRSFVFWQGGNVGDGFFYSQPVGVGGSCANSPCFTWKLRVDTPGAARLRVALDASTRNDGFQLQVTAPGGAVSSATNSNAFNSEIFIENPATGVYLVTVRPTSAENAEFALRAKLEGTVPVPAPDASGLLPPNLRPTAPYEFGFAAPANPLNGPFLAPDDANPPVSVAGHGPVSCSPDETLDDQAVRCLRFSFGLSNIGPGKFEVRGGGGGITSTDPQQLYQCIENPGGQPVSRPAGTSAFHPTHLHTHYNELIQVELHRVTDAAAGTMVPAGDGRKLGYSPANQSLADWFSFDQAPREPSPNTPGCQGASVQFRLSTGWGDVYRYQRAGNFVDFGTNPDGLYVVRLKIDPSNHVYEMSENDNVSYTYVRVALDSVQVLEHGRGQSPWDPNKQVLQLRRKAGVPW